MRVPKEIGEAVVILLQPYTEHHLTVQDIEEMLVEKEFLPEPEQEKLLSRKEAAAALHVSVPTVDRMLQDGELVPCRVRGRVFIRQSDVDQILRGR
ncbi:helix-turn-helix domain-containing protein [Tichowtungia aerotolerans]|uniref:Helix-turn-helix domain-containing protein n=1 Tax=Tichowtungia aerotolerans TaxID=2697043 RepID=A0A6P1M761_9BACT|nr:helix-turn-helix domain-containing protein [Tichowtungia aerotolerans]QHI69862.1 helix-turn-helix domain-containing protein [Tichowtungia aerotolerans]